MRVNEEDTKVNEEDIDKVTQTKMLALKKAFEDCGMNFSIRENDDQYILSSDMFDEDFPMFTFDKEDGELYSVDWA